MAAGFSFPEDDFTVDDELGYPRAYANLCYDLFSTPYSHGPPATFVPYTLQPRELATLKDLKNLFPVSDPEANPTANPRVFITLLWKQLHHLENAGFDPALFRVDSYGNVLYYHADPSSPLAWEVDHWFPLSRGGLTVQSNLRIIQQQVFEKKKGKLEFLVPWWDLQLGVSVNQFLSMFASSNTHFRQRAFSFLFSDVNTSQPQMKEELQNVEEEVVYLEQKNEEERAAIRDLELKLRRSRSRAEKCKRLAQAQSSYKAILEKMIEEKVRKQLRLPGQRAWRRWVMDDPRKQLRTFLVEQKAYEAGLLEEDPCEENSGGDGEKSYILEEEEEDSNERGKRNMEKWLQVLLENAEQGDASDVNCEEEVKVLSKPNWERGEEGDGDTRGVGRSDSLMMGRCDRKEREDGGKLGRPERRASRRISPL